MSTKDLLAKNKVSILSLVEIQQLRQYIGANNCYNSLNYIVYGLSAISLFVIISIIYLVPSDTEIIPVQTTFAQMIIFLEECINENKNSINLNGTTPNQFCMNMYRIQD